MFKMNPSEAEIDAIRLKLYEETKDLTREENSKRLNELGQQLSAEFGFAIGTPKKADKTNTM